MSLDLEQVSFGVIALLLVASGIASATVKRTFHSVMFLGVFLVSVAALYILLGSPLIGILQILVYVGGILTLFVFAVMFVAGDEKEEAEAPPRPVRSGAWSVLAALAVLVGVLFLATQYTLTADRAVGGLLGGHYESSDGGRTMTWTSNTLAESAGFVAAIAFMALLAVAGILAWLGARHTLDRWSGARIFGTLLAALLLGLLAGVASHGGGAWGQAAGSETGQAAANDLDNLTDALFGAQVIPLEILGVLLTAVMIGALVIARPMQAPPDAAHYAPISREQLAQSQDASDVARHNRPPAEPPLPPAPVAAAPVPEVAE